MTANLLLDLSLYIRAFHQRIRNLSLTSFFCHSIDGGIHLSRIEAADHSAATFHQSRRLCMAPASCSTISGAPPLVVEPINSADEKFQKLPYIYGIVT